VNDSSGHIRPDASSGALIDVHALAAEERRAAEELLEHARLLEARSSELEAARDAARRDLEEMEQHLARARDAFARFEESCAVMSGRGFVEGGSGRVPREGDRAAQAPDDVSDEATRRIAARRAADAVRQTTSTGRPA
jgi:hypothetical protein